ncbi:MAG: sigma-70 family RNA polymerase sigma factor [Planctomycetota bacterium]
MDNQPNPEALLQHADFLRSLARGLLAGADADDVEQETWLRALEHGPRHDANLKGWLSTVARNSARMWWRGESRRSRREGAVAKSEGVPSAADVASRVEIQSLLADAVKSLEEPYRTTVVLAFYDGLKPSEIARQQGIPVDTVRTRIRRALQRLRARLDQGPGGRSAWVAALAPLAWPRGAAAAVTGALVMSTRWKIALIILILIPTVWLGREAWRGRAGRGPARRDVAETSHAASGSDESERRDVRDAPEAPEAGLAAKGFRVRVVSGGRPVHGAWVRVRGYGGKDVDVAATGADGLVSTPHTKEVSVRAWHPDHGPGRLEIEEFEPGSVHEVEVAGGVDVPVEVLDRKSGAGVPDAVLHILSAGDPSGLHGHNGETENAFDAKTMQRVLAAVSLEDLLARRQQQPIFRMAPVKTDETGRAVLRGMPPGRFEAIVLHDDFLARRVRNAPVRARPVRIRLDVGAELEVVATSVRGHPGRGLVCEVVRGGLMPLPVAFARLDDEGRARFQHLPTGEFAVIVSTKGKGGFIVALGTAEGPAAPEEEPALPEVEPVTRVVTLREGQSARVDFAERAGVRLFGRVLRRGQPVANAEVVLLRGSEEIAKKKADDIGRYAFDEIEPGAYELRAGDAKMDGRRVELTAGVSQREFDIVLASGAITGRVLERDPLPDCSVIAAVDREGPSEELERGGTPAVTASMRGKGETDEQGRYRIDGLPDGRYRLLFAHGGKLAVRQVEIRDGATTEMDLDFERERLVRLRVSFADEKDEPVSAALMLRGAHNQFGEAAALGVGLDERKEYEYRLAPGRYRLTATSAGRAAIHGEFIDLAADRELTLRFVRGVDIELKVRRNGAPAPGAFVEIIQANGVRLGPCSSLLAFAAHERGWTAPADGNLVLPSIPPGRYRLRVDGKPRGPLVVGGSTTTRTVELAR